MTPSVGIGRHQVYPYWSTMPKLEIREVTEIHNLDYSCSHDSYYECMAKKFREKSHQSGIHLNSSKCQDAQICAPFSMPLDLKIPMCKKQEDQACSEILFSNVEEKEAKDCWKSCLVVEYSLYHGYSAREEHHDGKQVVFQLSYNFKPLSNWDRSNIGPPVKVIKTEYFIMTTMLMVGNVGGTLGMFLGFSFTVASEWVIGTISQLRKWGQRKRIRDIFKLKKTYQGRSNGN